MMKKLIINLLDRIISSIVALTEKVVSSLSDQELADLIAARRPSDYDEDPTEEFEKPERIPGILTIDELNLEVTNVTEKYMVAVNNKDEASQKQCARELGYLADMMSIVNHIDEYELN